MAQDAFGLEVTANSQEAVAAWDMAIIQSLEHRLSAAEHVKAALAADPEFVMGLCMRAAMMLQIGSNQVHPKIAEILARAKALAAGASQREEMHIAALEHWLAGNLAKSCALWQELLDQWPADIMALRLHHNGSFWTGDGQGLAKAPMAVLKALGDDMRASGFIMGMVAFGLEEAGDYGEAEKYGRAAVERNDNDLWALHSVAHVLEMQCRHDEGRKLLNHPFGTWSDRNPFKDHLWWHAALFALEEGDMLRVLELYDREVRVDETGFYLDVQNAASLLQRLELAGVDVGTRWEELADLAEARINDHVMPFTDAHFMLALTGAGRLEAAQGYLASLKSFAGSADNEVAAVTGNVTVPLSESLLANAQGRHGEAADGLYALRDDLSAMGASHAQRDVFQQILIDAMMKAERTQEARTLLEARLAARPGSGWAEDRLKALH
ncbi:MAG: tetratricopeptide repeat protein [Hyphomicrobiales bacterium]|nr:tetratricopeptide repeat protein [Hyphomicrobiales bacterium]